MLATLSNTTVRVAALDGLGVMVHMAGVELTDLLRQQGINASVFDEPDNRLTFGQMVRVLDDAARATGDDCIGLHMGAAQAIHVVGILGYSMRACPNLRAQLDQLSRYYVLHQDGAAIDFRRDGDVMTVHYSVYDGHIMLHRHDAEATLALAVSQCRSQFGLPHWAPDSVHFEHPAPKQSSERELLRFFGCPVYFSEPFNGLRFPARFLDTPLRTADQGLFDILTRYAEESLTRHRDGATLTGRTRRLIASGLSNGHADIGVVSGRMAMTPRTLQRRLAGEGRQFSELVDEVRRYLATQYLRDTRTTLTDAAFLLGYSDLTAFHRAFRRWFGQTPLDYQRQHRGPSSSNH